MEIIRTVEEIKKCSKAFINSGYIIGLVPTMGALHEGHLSLVDKIKDCVDKVIVSVFVNPKQFSQNEDLDTYPQTEKQDIEKCRNRGVDVVYFPTTESMYPSGFSTSVDIGPLGKELCGGSRTNYFNGIMLVIIKLIMQTKPNTVIFGEKDYQMLFLIRKLIEELNIDIKILQGETIRENDGLALSSRNVYLNHSDRIKANYLHNALLEIAREVKINPDNMKKIINLQKRFLEKNGFHLDYLEIRACNTLEKLTHLSSEQSSAARILAAAYLGKCRLIDNIALE